MDQPASESGKNVFGKVWAAAETSPASQLDSSIMPLAWILISTGLILILTVGIITFIAIRKSEEAMSGLLAEKGASLLMAFESALRTGMRSQAGLQIQPLLEEMTRSPDIEFVALTMPDGIIIAHSDRTRIGDNLKFEDDFLDEARLTALDPAENEKWKILQMEGKRLFLLYRHFTLGSRVWPEGIPEPTIFLGMDISPFEITRSQNRNYVIMLGSIIVLVAIAGLLALVYAQKAKESHKRQKMAEGEISRLEKEVQRQEKLAAIGTLAAGVAHEIRNPLSSIKGYATYFKQRFPEGSEDREAACVMLNETNRLNRVISDLLGLSTQGEMKIKPVQVDLIIKHILRLLRQNAASRDITLISRLAPKIPPVNADMEKLTQSLLNICLNAFDAVGAGGKVILAVSGGKHHICLSIKDNGKGIKPEILNKIFDPYFTTKGTGTGLGLAMVHKIITAHKGRIEVVSHPASDGAPGETIFHIWLKAAAVSGMEGLK